MGKTTLRQGQIVATLTDLVYHPAEGFQEQGTCYATEEVIAADSDTELECGPAMLIHRRLEYPVTVTVMEIEQQPGEEDDGPEDDEPACLIEIGCAEGLPKLALALGLLDHLTPKQALVGKNR